MLISGSADMNTFGRAIAEARKAKLLSQKELAARIKKEDGNPISAQYLNDIERDRRNAPSEALIIQFASELNIDKDYLCLLAGAVPRDLSGLISDAEPRVVSNACRLFRRTIKRR
jgi:transcriptional regulator with XRE-family HTH domain